MDTDFSNDLKQKNKQPIRVNAFLYVNCDNPNPLSLFVIEYKTEAGVGGYFTAFTIYPSCNDNFIIRIEEHGKVK